MLSAIGHPILTDQNKPNPLSETPDSIESTQFEWSDDPMEFNDEEKWYRADYPEPHISVNRDQIEVSGVLVYGSSTCNRIHITELSVAESKLTVGIGWEEDRPPSGGCTDDLDVGSYLLEIIFDSTELNSLLVEASHCEPTQDTGSKIVTGNSDL